MDRRTRGELIRLRHEKMAGREKQSADEGVRSLPASVFYLATHPQRVGGTVGGSVSINFWLY